jgi:hypothetical protein
MEINIIEKYTDSLFKLIAQSANVSEFILLYEEVFEKTPSQEMIVSYQKWINSESDDTDLDDDSYSYSYEDSYDPDDDDE